MGQVLLTCLCILFSLTLIIMDLSSIIYNPNKFQIPDIRPSYNLAELNLSLCPIFPTSLKGKLKIELNKSPLNWTQLEAKYRNMKLGGQFLPNCTARHRVAILIPYRNRDRELRILLDHLHPILQRQLITYGIYVIEQANDTYFNRGLLFNIGYDIASNFTNQFWECYIFHDVDLLPEDDRNLYTCPYQPRHMSVAINTFNYKLPYKDLFGGVSAMTTKQFIEVNGFSNRFWGWGGEDDDLRRRIKAKGLELTRYSPEIARYVMIKHQKAKPNPKRSKILKENPKMYSKDGLNSLQYSIKKITKYQTHTFISVSVKQKL